MNERPTKKRFNEILSMVQIVNAQFDNWIWSLEYAQETPDRACQLRMLKHMRSQLQFGEVENTVAK